MDTLSNQAKYHWLIVFLCSLLLNHTSRGQNSGIDFAAPKYSLDFGAADTAVGDFNGDGSLDVAAVSAQSLRISLGDKNGNLVPFVTYQLGKQLFHVSAADMNKDGKLDLVVSGVTEPVNERFLWVFAGKGDGTFQSPIATSGTSSPFATNDFNADGFPDVAFAYFSTYLEVDLLLGNSNLAMTFTQAFHLQNFMGFGGPFPVVSGDFNADGKADLVFGDGISARITMGDGTGKLTLVQTIEIPGRTVSVAAGDLNHDGFLDLAFGTDVTDQTTGLASINIQLGKGDGTFQQGAVIPVHSSFVFVSVSDVDKDGNLDLITADDGESIRVFLGKGNGQFNNPSLLPGGTGTSALKVADLNNDGYPEILSGTTLIYKNDGQGDFIRPQIVNTNGGPNLTADFNNDGKLDIVTSSSAEIAVLLGGGNGSFQSRSSIPVTTQPNSLLSFDLNKDGKLDLVAVFYGTDANLYQDSQLLVLLGNGDGTFAAGKSYPASRGARMALAGDFDGDGLVDLVIAYDGSPRSRFGGGVLFFKGLGDGSFKPGADIPQAAGLTPFFLASADFDRDGKLDLSIAENFHSDILSVLHGNGDGTFTLSRHYDPGDTPTSMLAADINQDGFADLLISFPDKVAVGLGSTNGFSFQSFILPRGVQNISLSDFDRDGQLDLAVAVSAVAGYAGTLNAVGILKGEPNGQFAAPIFLGGISGALSVAPGDFNSDKKPDLLVQTTKGSALVLNTSVDPGPTLNISLSQSGAKLSWSNTYANFILVSASNLSGSDWSLVNQTRTTNGSQFEVNVPLVNSDTYFRLQKAP